MADVNEVRSMDIYGKLPILVGGIPTRTYPSEKYESQLG